MVIATAHSPGERTPYMVLNLSSLIPRFAPSLSRSELFTKENTAARSGQLVSLDTSGNALKSTVAKSHLGPFGDQLPHSVGSVRKAWWLSNH